MQSAAVKKTANKATDRIAIVGTGAAGIVCARELAKRGWKNVVVFEAQHQPGGKTKSVVIPGSAQKSSGGADLEVPHVADLGTQIMFEGPVMKEILQDTGLDQQLFNQPFGRVKNLGDERIYHPFLMPLPMPFSLAAKIREGYRFSKTIKDISVLDQPGFRGLSNTDLTLPIEQWFNQHQFVYAKYMSLPFISTGICGTHFDRVPAAYMVKLQKSVARFPAWRMALFMNNRVRQGNAEIWRRAALGHDVRCNQPIHSIELHANHIRIGAGNQEPQTFEHLIWTGRLPTLSKLLGAQGEGRSDESRVDSTTAPSRAHFAKVKYLRRAMFMYRVEGLPKNILWLHSNEILNKNIGNPFITMNLRNADWHGFFPWLGDDLTVDEVDGKIREFVNRMGGRVVSLATDPMQWDYNPYFDSESLAQGVYDQIEADQGKHGIYVCGETLSGVTLPAVSEYAKALVERYF